VLVIWQYIPSETKGLSIMIEPKYSYMHNK
jgi:hypothetical protein